MHDLLVFIAGAVFAAGFIYLAVSLDAIDRHLERKHERRRPGYISFRFAQSNTEGRSASADPNADELSGGGVGEVAPPPHLRIVKGERE